MTVEKNQWNKKLFENINKIGKCPGRLLKKKKERRHKLISQVKKGYLYRYQMNSNGILQITLYTQILQLQWNGPIVPQ